MTCSDPITGTPYAYVGGDPLNATDPSGYDLCFHNPFNRKDNCRSIADTNRVARTVRTGAAVVAAGALVVAGGAALYSAFAGATATATAAGAGTAAASQPVVRDGRLQNIVGNLYKGVCNLNRVGDGTTAAALEKELATGLPTEGKFHLQKGLESINALRNWLSASANPNADPGDIAAAEREVARLWKAWGADGL